MTMRSLRAASLRRRAADASGQSMIEMAMILPLIVTLVLGLIELSYALLDQHVVTKLSREGANMISRDAEFVDAYNALQSMSTRPIDFSSRTKVIFTVIKNPSTTGATNRGVPVIYQRYTNGAGGVGGASLITCSSCSAANFPSPTYTANDADTNSALRVTGGLPANSVSLGGFVYVTEIYTSHPLITPFDRFGITVPNTLYSIAYF
jgi:Flp pilus assembly protein TadG